VFIYDSRPNREGKRRLTGMAAPGETVAITPPMRARPLVVVCTGGLTARYEDTAPDRLTFSGDARLTTSVFSATASPAVSSRQSATASGSILVDTRERSVI
jgi:hypothetical protein